VVGVNSAIAASGTGTYIGYGFAIPINLAKSVAKDLIAHGKVSRGYIGVNIGEVTDAIAKSVGLDRPKGVIIQGIVEGGSASKADIKAGDIILKIDGKEVNEPNELQGYIASKSAGASVKLTLFRDGKDVDRSVTLKAREDDSKTEPVVNKEEGKSDKESNMSSANFDKIGFTAKNLSSQEKKDLNIENGVVITEVKQFSKAEDENLQKGLVIVEADRKKIRNVNDLRSAIDNKKGSAILLRLQDGKGNSRFIGIEVPN
jgi:serine protease Do